MASGSQNMTTYNARIVTGSNNAASPAGALLLSGAGRADDATGDTWIFLDSNGGLTNPWGIKHDQANNKLQIFGSGTNSVSVRMDTGDTYILGKVGIGYDPETSGNTYKLYVDGTSFFNDHIYLVANKEFYMQYNDTMYNVLHNHNNGNISINAAGTGLYVGYYNTTLVNWMSGRMELKDGCLSIFPNNSNYREGIRIHSHSSWSDITLCGDDNTGDSGISANSWFIGNNNGNFYIARNGSPGSTAYIGCVSNVWKVVTAADIPEGAANLSGAATAHTLSIYRNGITIPYQMDNANDGGMLRVRGTTESNCILELGTWDDSGTGETIQFNYYPTTSQVTPTYSVSVPKHSGTLVTTDGNGASGTWGISITGNATTCSYPLGFSSRSTGVTWGNTTGTTITAWNDSAGGSCDWRMNNPSSGKMSLKVDGRFYGNEGTYPAMLMRNENSYWGLCDPDAANNVWIRTTNQGIIPFQSGNVGSGHCGLGTATWFFSTSYIDSMHTHQLIVEGATNATMTAASTNPRITFQENTSVQPVHILYCDWDSYRSPAGLKIIGGTSASPAWFEVEGNIYAAKVYNAVWNDFAEYREGTTTEAGRVVAATADSNKVSLTYERLQSCAHVISDTFGCSVGQSDTAQTPIGVGGRVLVYPYQPIENYHVGDCLCAAPNGTADIMTREEIIQYPDRIIGIVDEIPSYLIWKQTLTTDKEKNGSGKVETSVPVNGRIWIYVR